MTAPSPEIEPHHLRRRAIVCVRQSTPRRVLTNRESTRRRYQLAERARRMGRTAPQIQVVDDDLGLSGAASERRTGFQRPVAAIGPGEVGPVPVTGVPRPSRRTGDRHRVIEPRAVFRTPIADGDGVYDPRDPDDRPPHGVEGTPFAAELHIPHARMRDPARPHARQPAQRGRGAASSPCARRSATAGWATARSCPTPTTGCARRWGAGVRALRAPARRTRARERARGAALPRGAPLKMPRLLRHGPGAGRIVWIRPTYTG